MPQKERNDRVNVIRLETPGAVEEYLASTPGTRRFGSVDLVALCERRLAAISDMIVI